jgi:ribonuclease P protein component
LNSFGFAEAIFILDIPLIVSFVSKRFTLGKHERLKSRKQIDILFNDAKNFSVFPFRVHYRLVTETTDTPATLQFGVGVSTRNFKKAVNRNRVKRLVREAYRLQKETLQIKLQERKKTLHLFVNYTARELPDFNTIKEKTSVILKKILKLIDEHDNASA